MAKFNKKDLEIGEVYGRTGKYVGSFVVSTKYDPFSKILRLYFFDNGDKIYIYDNGGYNNRYIGRVKGYYKTLDRITKQKKVKKFIKQFGQEFYNRLVKLRDETYVKRKRPFEQNKTYKGYGRLIKTTRFRYDKLMFIFKEKNHYKLFTGYDYYDDDDNLFLFNRRDFELFQIELFTEGSSLKTRLIKYLDGEKNYNDFLTDIEKQITMVGL